MQWNEIDEMSDKEGFIALAQTACFTKTEPCAYFGISRKTGHNTLDAISWIAVKVHMIALNTPITIPDLVGIRRNLIEKCNRCLCVICNPCVYCSVQTVNI